jgi:hypothetical protein
MRRPNMSTGAWLFSGIVAAALIAPAGVYAAVTSHVAIGNVGNATTATVTSEHQLLTTPIAPNAIVRITGATQSSSCTLIYTPPAGKALVLLSATVDVSSIGGTDYGYIASKPNCADRLDWFATSSAQGEVSQQHTYPAGLPLSKLRLNTSYAAGIYATGYLIPTSQLPTN